MGGAAVGAELFKNLSAGFVVDVQGTLTGAASQLGQAEEPALPFAVVARLEGGEGVEPGFDDLRMHDGVERAVEQRAGAEAGQATRRRRSAPGCGGPA